MNTVYFLVFIAVCIVAVVWAMRASKAKTDLARKNRANRTSSRSEKLTTPPSYHLANSHHIWERRRKHANQRASDQPGFGFKSKAGSAASYDGYSRRDRHHISPSGTVKDEDHLEDRHGLTMSSIRFKNGDSATRS